MTAIDTLFRAMCDAKASDLHLSSGMPPLVRKDGTMQPLDASAGALDADAIVGLVHPIMPEKNRAEFRDRHDTDFAYRFRGWRASEPTSSWIGRAVARCSASSRAIF